MIRDFQYTDLPFILNSWIKSSKTLDTMWRGVPSSIYFTAIESKIKSLIEKHSIRILIYGESGGLILSYLVYEEMPSGNIYHYTYTKNKLRKKGLAKELVKESKPKKISIYTHSTNKAKKLLSDSETIIFNPFLFLEE